MSDQFEDSLRSALVEKDVENAYRAMLADAYPDGVITSPCRVDGYLRFTLGDRARRVLLEIKRDQNLSQKKAQMKIIGQCLLYMKAFRAEGIELPTHLLIGDKDQFIVVDARRLIGYLRMESVDWAVAPSKGSQSLVDALMLDQDALPVYIPTRSNIVSKLASTPNG